MSRTDIPERANIAAIPRQPPLRIFVLLGLGGGLAYGFLEALEFMLLSLIPGALAWRSGNASQVLWVAPLLYAPIGLLLGVLFFLLSRVIRGTDWVRVFVFVMLTGGTFLGAMLQGQVFSTLASILLALGIGIQLTRLFARHRARILAGLPRLAASLLVLVGLVALTERGIAIVREQQALARLPDAGGRPNVLVLVLDTLRADHVSAYGYGRPTTPRLDALARTSRTFVNAYSSSSWTLPAHASLMTGRPVHDHRAGNAGRPYLDGRFPTLAEVLGNAGYASGAFVANVFWCGRHTGLQRGFAHYDDMYGNPGDAAARTVLGRLLAYHVLPSAGLIDIPGRRNAAHINRSLLDWVDHLDGTRPFFAFANYMDVHGPYLPPPGFAGQFSPPGPSPAPTRIELGDIDAQTSVPERAVLRRWIDRYDESLLYLDTEIGRLLDELEVRGVLDHTIVVVTSDHGESWGEHDLLFHGHSLYQEQVRIPLIVHVPGDRQAQRDPRPVTLQDVPGLLTRLVDVPSPFAAHSGEATPSPVALSEVGRRNGMPPGWPTAKGGLRSLQDERWQLIVGDARAAELYDVLADPGQLHDLASDPAYAAVMARLKDRLAALVSAAPPIRERKTE